jgi:hypothetical protein
VASVGAVICSARICASAAIFQRHFDDLVLTGQRPEHGCRNLTAEPMYPLFVILKIDFLDAWTAILYHTYMIHRS